MFQSFATASTNTVVSIFPQHSDFAKAFPLQIINAK